MTSVVLAVTRFSRHGIPHCDLASPATCGSCQRGVAGATPKNHTVRCCVLKGKIQASLVNWWGQSNEGVFNNLYGHSGHSILNLQWRAPSPRFVILNREKAAVVLSRRSFSSNADGKKLGPLAGVRVLDMTRVLAGQEKSDSARVQLCKWFETDPNFTTHLITLTHVESHQFTLTSEAFQHQTMKQLWQTVLRSGRTMLHSDLGWSWRWNRQAWKTQSGWWHPRFRTAFPTWCWRGAFEQGNMEKIRESNEKSCLLRIQCLSKIGMQIQHLPKDKKWGKMSCRTCPTCPGTNVSLLCSAEPQQELCDSELYQTGGTGASHELARFR